MKRIVTSALAFALAALMLVSCTPATTPTTAAPTDGTTAPSGDTPTTPPTTPTIGTTQPTTNGGPVIPDDLRYYDDATVIGMLRDTPYAQHIDTKGNIGLSRVWDVGVRRDRFEHEEIMTVPTDARVYDAADYNVTPDGQYNAANLNRLIADLAAEIGRAHV